MEIALAKDFSDFLINRDEHQNDGADNAVDFRRKFLADLDSKEWWEDATKQVVINFDGVDTLAPSWANEAFAYYTKFCPDVSKVLSKIILKHVNIVHRSIIETEVKSGYQTRK